ncbi:MAG TPA: hypothetical protein VLA31_07495 [Burkholderiaceae bacterium]|nr:hypothetical protein [Burkholderiaceae bacterium]
MMRTDWQSGSQTTRSGRIQPPDASGHSRSAQAMACGVSRPSRPRMSGSDTICTAQAPTSAQASLGKAYGASSRPQRPRCQSASGMVWAGRCSANSMSR